MTIEQSLADSWEIGRVILCYRNSEFRELIVVGKEKDSLQMTRRINRDGERIYLVEEYGLEDLTNSKSGGYLEYINPRRVITTINTDEYWGRVKTTEEKQKYIEILRKL